MEIILILIAFFVLWKVLISLAKSSDAYLEFVVNGIKPEIDKLIQNQPKTRKYIQNLNSLQQWKNFSSKNYLKKRFEEDKYLQECIKNDIPRFKKNIADYQSSYDRILSEFHLKKTQQKWYVSFQIEKDIRQSQQRFSNSNYNNIFDIEWRYTSPQGRNSYESRSKFTLYQVGQVLSQIEENKAFIGDTKYQGNLLTQSSGNENLTLIKSGSFNNYNDNSIIDITRQSMRLNLNLPTKKYGKGVPKWTDKNIYSFSEINNATSEQVKFYNFFKKSFTNGEIVSLEGNYNYAFILMFDFQNEYEKDNNFLKFETRLNKLGNCWPDTKPYGITILKKKREEKNISASKKEDDSIIDVTGQSTRINSNVVLAKYIPGVPYWSHQYVYSYSEINSTSIIQKEFYRSFKYSFLDGVYYELEGNTNYAFILLFDLLNEYDNYKNISTLESQLKILGECYPKTKSYGISFLNQKIKSNNYTGTMKYEENSYNNYEEYWKLGSKYKDKLKLNEEEVKLLNNIYNPSNNFFNIEYCGIEILKLYISTISTLKSDFIQDGKTIDGEFKALADLIASKVNGNNNYYYGVQSIINEFYSHIFKHCENAVREFYSHKRKLNTDNYYSNLEAKTEFETKIISKVTELIPILILKVSPPDEATEIELYSQNTNRWKIKFEELTTNYNEKPKEYMDSIISLGKLNKKNPSVENIFFEASKFITKYDKESALSLYVYYLHYDLKSTTFDNKQHTKTIQKSIFKTNEQLHDFEKIVSELIMDKDLEKALKQIPEIYKIKRKKIQLNRASINEVIEQHSETVELLNEYLKDDFEDENNSIKSQEISNEEIQIEITQKSEEIQQSAFVSELTFTTIHTTTLELFAKSNFSISQDEFEVFAKSKGVFKNSLIESINDTCYEFLDDVLIEEEEDYYTINTNYFQKISIK